MTQDSDSSSSSVKELNRMTLPSLKVWPIIATVGLIMFAFMGLVVFIALPAHLIFHTRPTLEQRRKQEKRIALIWPVPKLDWFPPDHEKNRWRNGNCFEIFCEDDPDYPEARREASPEGKIR